MNDLIYLVLGMTWQMPLQVMELVHDAMDEAFFPHWPLSSRWHGLNCTAIRTFAAILVLEGGLGIKWVRCM